MDVHQNARLTPRCRELLVARVRAGRRRAEVARELGVSEPTVRKWVQRFQAKGVAGPRDRSSRPQRSPNATAKTLQLAVVAVRRQRLTMATIAAARSTVRVGSTCTWPSTTARGWPAVRRLPEEEGVSARAFLRAAVACYAGLVVTIREVLIDNGVCYRAKVFAATCAELGLKHRRTPAWPVSGPPLESASTGTTC